MTVIGSVLSVSGLVLATVGAFILAFSLNRAISELVICLQFVDVTLGALCSGGAVPRFEGIETRLKKGVTSAKNRTMAGVVLVAIGLLFQLGGALLTRGCS